MAPTDHVGDAATELIISMHELLTLKRMCEMQAQSILTYLDDGAVEEENGWYAFGRLAEMIRIHLDTEEEMIDRMMDMTIA